jgi:hypothetical protein
MENLLPEHSDKEFNCGSHMVGDVFCRSIECYETEIWQLKTRLGEEAEEPEHGANIFAAFPFPGDKKTVPELLQERTR